MKVKLNILDKDISKQQYIFNNSLFITDPRNNMNYIYEIDTNKYYSSYKFTGNKRHNNEYNINISIEPTYTFNKIFIFTTYNDRNVLHYWKDTAHTIEGYLQLNDPEIKIIIFEIQSNLKELILSYLKYLKIDIDKILFIKRRPYIIKANQIYCYLNHNINKFYKSLQRNPYIKSRKVILSRRSYRYKIKESIEELKEMGDKNYFNKYKNLHRVLLNNEWEEQLVNEYGFESIYIENYLFEERLKLLSEINILVMEIGAGLIHLHWVPNGMKLILLVNEKNASWANCIKKCNKNINIKIIYGKSFYSKYRSDNNRCNQPWLIDNEEVVNICKI